jgi:hypothetical protein
LPAVQEAQREDAREEGERDGPQSPAFSGEPELEKKTDPRACDAVQQRLGMAGRQDEEERDDREPDGPPAPLRDKPTQTQKEQRKRGHGGRQRIAGIEDVIVAERPLEAIPRHVPHRMTAIGYNFIPNIAALYEVEDVRGYEAMTFKPLFETYPLWCVHQPVWYNRVDDPRGPFSPS